MHAPPTLALLAHPSCSQSFSTAPWDTHTPFSGFFRASCVLAPLRNGSMGNADTTSLHLFDAPGMLAAGVAASVDNTHTPCRLPLIASRVLAQFLRHRGTVANAHPAFFRRAVTPGLTAPLLGRSMAMADTAFLGLMLTARVLAALALVCRWHRLSPCALSPCALSPCALPLSLALSCRSAVGCNGSRPPE